MDFVDVDSEKWRQYAEKKPWPMKWVYRREAEKLAQLERHIAERADASLFVSQAEASVFRKINPGLDCIYAISNGIDFTTYDPALVQPLDLGQGPHLVFTGAMDYWANADAIRWFVKGCWPQIKRAYPTVRLHVVGAHPLAEVQALHDDDNINVTGRVDDVKPYIRAADISIAPMIIARGIQNKVLEAMALARPVVTTGSGAEGIDAVSGTHFMIADTEDEFTRSVITLLADKEKAESLGYAARAKLSEGYSWDAKLNDLDAILVPTSIKKAM
jgi:sugar transferase (PEP-CTERM/EpsH1 system associated)